MEYARIWKVGDRTFTDKIAAQKYEAETALAEFTTPDELVANADRVVALLKPFTTPRPRKKKGNGEVQPTGGSPRPGRKRDDAQPAV